MPNFRYRALTQHGEIVHGTLSAPTAAEVAHRIEYLRLLPIETIEDKATVATSGPGFGFFARPSQSRIAGRSGAVQWQTCRASPNFSDSQH